METKEVDTDWQRTAILTHNFLTTYSGPYLALRLLLGRGTPGRHLPPPTPFGHLLAMTLTDRDSVPICVYKISKRPCVPIVNPRDQLPAVNPRSCLHLHITCFPVITLFTQMKHPVPEIPDWRLYQRSICKKWLKVIFFLEIIVNFWDNSY